jgi:hypothetical protein
LKVDDQSCLRTWLVRPGTSFSHHAVVHSATKKYFAVQEGRFLSSWSESQDNLEKLARVPAPGIVVALFTPDPLASHIVCVCDNGTVASLSAHDLRSSSSISTGSPVLASTCALLSSGGVVVFIASATTVTVIEVGDDGTLMVTATIPLVGAPRITGISVDMEDRRLFILGMLSRVC